MEKASEPETAIAVASRRGAQVRLASSVVDLMMTPDHVVSTHIDIDTAASARVFARVYRISDADFARRAIVYWVENKSAPQPAPSGRMIDLEIPIHERGAHLFACMAKHQRTDLSTLLANALGAFTTEIYRARRADGVFPSLS